MTKLANDNIRKTVRKQYGKVAKSNNSCCDYNDSNALGYSKKQLIDIPEGANMGLGCGNPQAIASLKAGETVLDLGSGGGFDCFLAAKQVAKYGHIIGVDMTPEMVSKARHNVEKTNYNNIEFRLGEIEHLPVADNIIDVIISNCVINLSPEKQRVFQESFRVLKSGGRLAISDIVATAELPEALKNDMTVFTGCMAGASSITDIEKMLKHSGFINIDIKPKNNSKKFIQNWIPNSNIEDYVVSATIEAIKP